MSEDAANNPSVRGRLTLSRRVGESIVLDVGGESIHVMLSAVRRGQAQIAIDAPLSVIISRGDRNKEYSTFE